MIDHEPTFRRIIVALEAAGIPYMVSGSAVSGFFGEYRGTYDIDFVIDPSPHQLDQLLAQMPPEEVYVSHDAARAALAERGMFNVIDHATGVKADLIIRKRRPFSEAEFARRRAIDIAGIHTFVVTPEDSILSKLEWAAQTGSHRQVQDAIGVASVQWDELDRAYLERWAGELGVSELLRRVLQDAARLR